MESVFLGKGNPIEKTENKKDKTHSDPGSLDEPTPKKEKLDVLVQRSENSKGTVVTFERIRKVL